MRDVCHLQFNARIGFKAVWCPGRDYTTLALVGDGGELLASGRPQGALPGLRERRASFAVVRGSRFEAACKEAVGEEATGTAQLAQEL